MNKIYSKIMEQFFYSEVTNEYTLENIARACEYFNHPEKSFRSIHIAGTNGKGSVSKMIFQILKESGKRTGVYTSPHLIDIRERFETEKGLISEEEFTRLAIIIIESGLKLSYFEKCVILAFLYFREEGCEYAVIEVGMGGRLDATNIITPILSIITSISYDHMEFLGYTLEHIATQKGGIIKPGVPVLLYGKNPTLEHIASLSDSTIIYSGFYDISTNLVGGHQITNARIAYEAGKFLQISEHIIRHALSHIEHRGRMQYIRPNLLIDGAHNEDGMEKLKIYLDSQKEKWEKIILSFNLKEGKNVQLVTNTFSNIREWNIVISSGFKVSNSYLVAEQIRELGQTAFIMTPAELIELSEGNPKFLYVVFGSLYMIGDFFG